MSHLSLPSPHRHPRWQWWLALGCGGCTLLFGTLGAVVEHGGEWTWQVVVGGLYHSLQMLILHTPHLEEANGLVEAGRWCGAATFFLVGLTALARLVSDEWRRGWFAAFGKQQTVVYGLDETALPMIRWCLRQGGPVVAIDLRGNEGVAESCTRLGALVVAGEADYGRLFAAARLGAASRLIVACEDDRVALDVAVKAGEWGRTGRPAGAGRLPCHVQINDQQLRQELAAHHRLDTPEVEIRLYDPFQHAAQRLLTEVFEIEAVAEARQLHLIIVGLGKMGMSVALQAAAQYGDPTRKRLRISVIERKPGANEETMKYRYPQFHACCELEYYQVDVLSPAARDHLARWAADPSTRPCIAICFDNDRLALDVALSLLPTLGDHDAQIAVRVSHSSGVREVIRKGLAAAGGKRRIQTFGHLDGDDVGEALQNSP